MSPVLLGLIFTAGGVGTFVGAWYGTRVTRLLGYGRALLATMFLGNTATIGVLLVTGPGAASLPIFTTLFFLLGLGTGLPMCTRSAFGRPRSPSSSRAGLLSWEPCRLAPHSVACWPGRLADIPR